MSELTPILQEMIALTEAGKPCALCAVVATRGSTPQSPGAALLLREDCSTLGTLGGGCVEEEVKRRAHGALTTGQAALFDFVLDHDYGWDDGMICGGRMDIAVMPMASAGSLDLYRDVLSNLQARRPAVLPVRAQQEGQPVEYHLNLEVPPTLLIAGGGHVGLAVAKLARDLDFHVVVIDDREEYASPERFGDGIACVVDDIALTLQRYPIDRGCYVVIVTRGHANDHQALDAVIRSDAAYIGLIGSKRKSKMILKDLAAAGVTPEVLDRVHTPIGLPIGAVTVPEIAVSIAAQLVEQRRKTAGKVVDGPFEVST